MVAFVPMATRLREAAEAEVAAAKAYRQNETSATLATLTAAFGERWKAAHPSKLLKILDVFDAAQVIADEWDEMTKDEVQEALRGLTVVVDRCCHE